MTLKTMLCMTILVFAALGPARAQSAPDASPPSAASSLRAAGQAAADAVHQGATPEEADRLTKLFQSYLGTPGAGKPGAVTVTPAGDAYKMAVDVARLVPPNAASAMPFDLKAGLYVATLTPVGDGTWRVTSDTFPPISITAGDQTTSIASGDFKFDGVFDPKIAGFRTATSTSSGVTVGSISPGKSMQLQYSGNSTYKQTMEDTGDGTVTTKIVQGISDFGYKLAMSETAKPTDDQPAPQPTTVTVDAHAAKLTGEATVANLRIKQLMDLYAFLRAHSTKDDLAAHQAEFKGLLISLLPAASSAFGQTDLQKLVVNTPQGAVGLGNLFERLEIGGAAAKDQVNLTFKASDPSLPAGLVPDWAAGLVPTSVELNAKVGPIHLDDALLKLIAAFDLTADKPMTDEQGTELMEALGVPQQTVVELAPSTIVSPLITVKMAGDLHFNEAAPTGSALIVATGLDKGINAVQQGAQSDPSAAQVVTFLTGMRLLANAEPDGSYSWHVTAKPDGQLMLNGKPLSPSTSAPDADSPGTANP